MTLQPPDSREDWAAARRLVEEYASSLPVDLGFQDFPRELVSLASDYGPPHGHFVLATQDEALIGCGGLRRVSDSVCEMKRFYVVPAHRGQHVGRAIAEALIAYARRVGYETMLLDTLPSMSRARNLFRGPRLCPHVGLPSQSHSGGKLLAAGTAGGWVVVTWTAGHGSPRQPERPLSCPDVRSSRARRCMPASDSGETARIKHPTLNTARRDESGVETRASTIRQWQCQGVD